MQALASLIHTISTADVSLPLQRWLPALQSCSLTPSDHEALMQILAAPQSNQLCSDAASLDAYGSSLSAQDTTYGVWQPWF